MRRTWFKKYSVVVVAVAAAIAVGGIVWSRQREARRLDEALAALDGEDPDWRVDGVVKRHNAAVPIDDAANSTKLSLAAHAMQPPSGGSRLAAISTAHEIPGVTWDNERLPRDEEFCSLYEVHLDSAEAHRVALAAAKLPRGGLPLHFGDPDPNTTPTFHWFAARKLSALLDDYATVEAYFGRGDEALRAVSATLHYAQTALATEPTFHSQRVRLGCATTAAHGAQRTLAWTEPSRELADLQAAFAAAAAVDGVTLAFRGERAAILRIYDNVRSGDLPAAHLDAYLGGPPRAALVTRYQRRLGGNSTVRDQAEVLRASSAFVAAARLSGPARRAACDDIEAGLSPGLTQFFRYARAAVEHDDVGRARLLCASVGLACERYRRQFGRWPATLAEVPASILPALPPDPLTGEAFAYQVLSDGAIVYSVSKVAHVRPGSTDEDVSILGWELAAKFRLWNLESRRRPPRPDPTPEDEP